MSEETLKKLQKIQTRNKNKDSTAHYRKRSKREKFIIDKEMNSKRKLKTFVKIQEETNTHVKQILKEKFNLRVPDNTEEKQFSTCSNEYISKKIFSSLGIANSISFRFVRKTSDCLKKISISQPQH